MSTPHSSYRSPASLQQFHAAQPTSLLPPWCRFSPPYQLDLTGVQSQPLDVQCITLSHRLVLACTYTFHLLPHRQASNRRLCNGILEPASSILQAYEHTATFLRSVRTRHQTQRHLKSYLLRRTTRSRDLPHATSRGIQPD